MFRLPFKFLWSSNNIKNLNVIKFEKKIVIFYENHPPTRHLKYKKIDLAPFNQSIMANKLLLTLLGHYYFLTVENIRKFYDESK